MASTCSRACPPVDRARSRRGSTRSMYASSACHVNWFGSMKGRKSIRLASPARSSLMRPTTANAESSSAGARDTRYGSMLSRAASESPIGCSWAHARTFASTRDRSLSGTAQWAISRTRPWSVLRGREHHRGARTEGSLALGRLEVHLHLNEQRPGVEDGDQGPLVEERPVQRRDDADLPDECIAALPWIGRRHRRLVGRLGHEPGEGDGFRSHAHTDGLGADLRPLIPPWTSSGSGRKRRRRAGRCRRSGARAQSHHRIESISTYDILTPTPGTRALLHDHREADRRSGCRGTWSRS